MECRYVYCMIVIYYDDYVFISFKQSDFYDTFLSLWRGSKSTRGSEATSPRGSR